MSSGCRGGGRKQTSVNAGLPCSFHPLKESHPDELPRTEEKSVRIKRCRTRRERNYVKFGRNITTDRVPDQRPSYKGPQKMFPPFWGSQLSSCINKSVPIQTTEGAYSTKPVIITQNRLTQHLGMFNREVKSADIERLLSPRTEQQVVEVTPLQKDCGPERQLGEELYFCKSCDADQKCIPSELLGSSVKDLCEDHENSFPTVVRAGPALISERCSVAAVCGADAGSQPSVGPSAVEFGQQLETQTLETEILESNAMILNEKENVPPVTTVGAESYRGKSPVRQLAQDLEKLLDLKARFPGRNLISETRQAVIDALLDQKKTLPDFSALLLLKKLAGGCNRGNFQADLKCPADRDQGLPLELKSTCCSRHSDQGVSLKKGKGREQLFLTSPILSSSPALRMAEERSSQREDLESFESEIFDQRSFYLAAVQPLAHFPSASAQHVNSATRSSFTTEDQCPQQETLLRITQQGLRKALRKPKSRQEKTETSNGQLPKKNISKRHSLPFAPHDSLGSVNLSVVGKGSDHFPLAELQQYSCVYELSPEQWNFQETELTSVPSLHHSQGLHDYQPLDLGFRTTERTTSESQTSFDVLKSIWSPKVAGRGAKLPASRASGYPCLTHQPPSSRELNSEQGQPKEFFQLYSIIPQQHCSLDRQNPQQEVCMPSRHPQHGNGLSSVLAKPRTHCQKVSLEEGKTSNSYQFWSLREAPARMQGSRDKGCPGSGNQVCSLERLLQMEGMQQLRVFQQLPMSYFPPSEALENRHSPLYTLQGQLLGQPSPEPWAFPRMKLY